MTAPCLVRAASLLLCAAAISAASAAAQGVEATPVKYVTLDLAVPDSPAFAVLGLSPESIVRPGSPRELATTLLNGVDRRGNLQSGVAVDFAPRFLFAGNSLTYGAYRDSKLTQLTSRTQLSFATAKGTGDGDTSLRLAVGIRATLWDEGDPRLDERLIECLDRLPVPVPSGPLLSEEARIAWEEAATAERRPQVEGCHTAFKKRAWNASSLAIGASPAFQSDTGSSRDLAYAGTAAWAALALELSGQRPFGQAIVQGRYRNKEQVPSEAEPGTFFERDSGGLGVRLTLGSADRAAVVESELTRESQAGSAGKTAFMLSGGGQVKLANGAWLSFSVGGKKGGASGEQRGAFVLSSFKWAMSREPAVQAP